MEHYSVFNHAVFTQDQIMVIEGNDVLDAIKRAFKCASPVLQYDYDWSSTKSYNWSPYYQIFEHGHFELKDCFFPCVWVRSIEQDPRIVNVTDYFKEVRS